MQQLQTSNPGRRAYYLAWYAAHRDEQLAYKRAYYAAHREQQLQAQKADRAAHPEKRRNYRQRTREARQAYMAKWEAKNAQRRRAYHQKYEADNRLERRERARAYRLVYAATHREEKRIKAREWARSNPERNRARVKAWAKANPDKANTLKIRHRALKKGASGSHTAREWREKVASSGGVCVYCGKAGPLTRDHAVPLAKGGSDSIENIVPACARCNASKGTRTAAQFWTYVNALPQPRPANQDRLTRSKREAI